MYVLAMAFSGDGEAWAISLSRWGPLLPAVRTVTSTGRLLPRNPSGNRYLWGPPYVCSCTLGGGGQLRPRTPPLSLSIGA